MTRSTITLRGMTWSDPRGYDPMIATAAAFAEQNPGVEISWDKRSLQDFESFPVEELAENYDLMVIDHPHLGAVAKHNCLLPLQDQIDAEKLETLANQSVGLSFQSYNLDGQQWALPIDAATQVQAFRPDLTQQAATWKDVVDQARSGHVIWPLRPPHSLMNFYTLAANTGHPCAVEHGDLIGLEPGIATFDLLTAVASHVDDACYEIDPIAALDALATSDRFNLCPLAYLYKGYAETGYREHPVQFTDIAAAGKLGPVGSALGGTGIAISAKTAHPDICARYAQWVASRECQETLYVASNGQPGNAVAWENPTINEAVKDSYIRTRATHEGAWLRPRHDGYMDFQSEASEIVNDALRGKAEPAKAVQHLNERFRASFL